MSKFVIAVVSGTQARLFTLEESELFPERANLKEHQGLNNPTGELQGKELWANTKTGRNRGSNGQAHSYDDHRQDHVIELERQFAQKIISRIIDLLESQQARQLILVAEPQILGLMREDLKTALPKNVYLRELSKDICSFSLSQIHDYLARKQLLPARARILE